MDGAQYQLGKEFELQVDPFNFKKINYKGAWANYNYTFGFLEGE